MNAAPVEEDSPLLTVCGLGRTYGPRIGCRDVGFELFAGEVLAVVGESGSGKSTLLSLLSTQLQPSAGTIHYRMRRRLGRRRHGPEAARTALPDADGMGLRPPKPPRQGLRMGVSAGGQRG